MEGLSEGLMQSELPIAFEMDSSVSVKMILSNNVDRSIYSYLNSERRTSITLHCSSGGHA